MTDKNGGKRAAARPVTSTDKADGAPAVLAKLAAITISTLALVLPSAPLLALDPSLDVSQYGHTAWTAHSGFSVGDIVAMAQTPDGYLWLGTEFGLFRFDGVRSVPWQPPAGQQLPHKSIFSLLVTHDGTLWIGTYAGLASWNGGKLTRFPQLDAYFVASLFEDPEGTVWVGGFGSAPIVGRLCAIRGGSAQCHGEDGAFGAFVWSFCEDSSGNLWAAAQSGLWRWKPGPPRRYVMPRSRRVTDLSKTDDGRPLIASNTEGLKQFTGDRVEAYRLRGVVNPNGPFPYRDVTARKLLRDRDGGLWIGTVERGLIHEHRGRTDAFTKSSGLSGDVVLSLFEDREGNIWVATTGGIDRFRELPVYPVSAKQGLSSDVTSAVVAAPDGSMWVGTHDGLTRWKNRQPTVFRQASGLPHDTIHSLFLDYRGRIWASTERGVAYFNASRFVAVDAIPSGEVYSITGDTGGNVWLSGNGGLSHLVEGRLVEHFPWSALRRREQAKVLLSDRGGLWLSFWTDGGVSYFKDGQLGASYTAANGLGKGHTASIYLDRDGALWASTEEGGLSRIKDGRIATLTSRNGLPCDTIHWTIEDDAHSFWLYTACGLVRIARSELDAWIADPKRRIETAVWDEADGVRLRAVSPATYNPPVAKSTDGRLWFLTGEGVQIVDPRHLAVNNLAPPVLIEHVVADGRIHGPDLPRAALAGVRLPAGIRDLQIGYTALSLVAPEKVRFRYKLEGQDRDWREVVGVRRAQYTNLPPGGYRFRVIACNNSGVWNEEGAALDFTIAPTYYQTIGFRALAAAALVALLWAAYRLRVRVIERHSAEIGAFNEQLMKAQEQERTRIAGDLHDSVMQQITALSLVLGTAKRMMPGDSEARDMVVKVQGKLIDLGTEVRQLSHDLYPPMLEEAGLAEVLRGYCDAFGHARGIAVACELDESVADLSPGTALALYRIAQEALGNAAKHAAPTRVDVRLQRIGGDVVLTVADDGRGYDPGRVADKGLGLVNMRERARQLGGRFELDSRPGRGTTVRGAVPFRIREAKPPEPTGAQK